MPSTNSRLLRVMALAAAIAVPAEGLRQYAYLDPGGILTVCYGHTGKDVEKGKKYSLEECDALLDADMRHAVATVARCHPGLPEKVLAAFSDAVYNLGPRVACGPNSTASRHLAAGRLVDACWELPRWDKAYVLGVLVPLPGLVKRRALELKLCIEGATS